MKSRLLILLLLAASACSRHATELEPAPPPTASATMTPTAISRPTTQEEKARALATSVRLVQEGRCTEAVPLLRNLLDAYPLVEDYHLHHLAVCSNTLGDTTTAQAAWLAILNRHQRSVFAAEAALEVGRTRHRRGDSVGAEPLLERATSTHDLRISRAARFELAEIDLERAEVRRAYETFSALRKDAAGSDVGKRSRGYVFALRGKYPELAPTGKNRVEEIELLNREGDYDGAMRELAARMATASPADRVSLLQVRARIEKANGNPETYLQTLRQIHQGHPDSPFAGEALYQEARWYWNKDSDAIAKQKFLEFEKRYPRHKRMPTVRYALARIAQGAGDHAAALRGFRRVIDKHPRSRLAKASRRQLAWILYDQQRWNQAADAFASLSRTRSVAKSADTIYWRARSYEQGGNRRARGLYESIVERAPDSYYAALAAERVGEQSQFDASTVSAPQTAFPAPPQEYAGDYHLVRAGELHRAGLNGHARREVRAFRRAGLKPPRSYMIDLYRSIDAHRDAIRLASRNRDRYAEILHPLAFWDTVQSNAERFAIDPLLALSLMRQESMFDPEARSPANARGLMQLLPSTAAQVAERIGRGGSIDLYDPQTNIELGIAHLRELADRYDGDHERMLAAYNAGAAAVTKWDTRSGNRPADEWVEAISYRETRNYVKKVLANYQKYLRLYGQRTARP